MNDHELELLRAASRPLLDCFRSWCTRLPAANQAALVQCLQAGDKMHCALRATIDGRGQWAFGLESAGGEIRGLAVVDVVPGELH